MLHAHVFPRQKSVWRPLLSHVSPYSPTVPNGCLGLRPSW
ncbi:unnamed protein product [Acanthoscelides obtectus]|uniref:Uncharacterized protein n=1 Tax=Acanthoscelides obtectus TaxID=200917 RepID=A0A9P0JNR2_ACAOB|nr:unnamed protein product [Acanthoscelides obtectus]CAK1642493.1 hypothetical protein AOBTE_LOCUS13063 [Acanthoscelides obtectus]